MKIVEVMIKGNTVITITDQSQKIPYVSIGLSKKDCMNQFYGTVKRLKNRGLNVWHTKPETRFDNILSIDQGTTININGGYRLTAVIVIDPVLTTIIGEPIK